MSQPQRQPVLGAILLAAGPSTRLGQPKQLVEYGGEPLVRRAARLLQCLEPGYVTVVCGHESQRVKAALDGLPVTAVDCRNWSQGMGASINAGARSMPQGADGVLVMVCDQWRMSEVDLQQLKARWLSDISRIVVASWKEETAYVSGPPVIFPRSVVPELKSMQENRGARQLVDRYMDIVEFVELENAAFDLDRPVDLQDLLGEHPTPDDS